MKLYSVMDKSGTEIARVYAESETSAIVATYQKALILVKDASEGWQARPIVEVDPGIRMV